MAQKLSRLLSAAMLLAALSCQAALATELPPGVLNYIRQKDPKVQVRFDGVVIFSNGHTYLPVIPQDPEVNPDPVGVVNTMFENKGFENKGFENTTSGKADYPDLVHFDNNFFLIRLIQTSSGRLVLPKLASYPVQLKEGLLPQDLVIPEHLFIPDELKIILGELHYKPTLEGASPQITPAEIVKKPVSPTAPQILDRPINPPKAQAGTMPLPQLAPINSPQARQVPQTVSHTTPVTPKVAFAYSLDDQTLMAIDVHQGKQLNQFDLKCMPSAMVPSTDRKQLYVACLSSSELLSVDLASGLIKARVPLGSKPEDVILLPKARYLVVSNRYNNFISLINTQDMLPATAENNIVLGDGHPGVLAAVNNHQIFVADAFDNRIYQVNLQVRKLERTMMALKNTSALWLYTPVSKRPQLWAASRSENKVQVLDMLSGASVATIEVGAKPVALQGVEDLNGDKIYVLCAGGERLDVIDADTQTLKQSIALPAGTFPTTMAIDASEQRAYIGGAGKNGLVVVDLATNAVSEVLPLAFRTYALKFLENNNGDSQVVVSPSLPILEVTEGAATVVSDPAPSVHNITPARPALLPAQSANETLREDTSTTTETETEADVEGSVSSEAAPASKSGFLNKLLPKPKALPTAADAVDTSTRSVTDTVSSSPMAEVASPSKTVKPTVRWTLNADESQKTIRVSQPGQANQEIRVSDLKEASKKIFKKWTASNNASDLDDPKMALPMMELNSGSPAAAVESLTTTTAAAASSTKTNTPPAPALPLDELPPALGDDVDGLK